MRFGMRKSIPLPGPFYVSFGGKRRRRSSGPTLLETIAELGEQAAMRRAECERAKCAAEAAAERARIELFEHERSARRQAIYKRNNARYWHELYARGLHNAPIADRQIILEPYQAELCQERKQIDADYPGLAVGVCDYIKAISPEAKLMGLSQVDECHREIEALNYKIEAMGHSRSWHAWPKNWHN